MSDLFPSLSMRECMSAILSDWIPAATDNARSTLSVSGMKESLKRRKAEVKPGVSVSMGRREVSTVSSRVTSRVSRHSCTKLALTWGYSLLGSRNST